MQATQKVKASPGSARPAFAKASTQTNASVAAGRRAAKAAAFRSNAASITQKQIKAGKPVVRKVLNPPAPFKQIQNQQMINQAATQRAQPKATPDKYLSLKEQFAAKAVSQVKSPNGHTQSRSQGQNRRHGRGPIPGR